MKLWISRDENGPYNLTKFKKDNCRKNEGHGEGDFFEPSNGWSGFNRFFQELCVDQFETATSFRLKPGEGPVKVNLEITRV